MRGKERGVQEQTKMWEEGLIAGTLALSKMAKGLLNDVKIGSNQGTLFLKISYFF